MVSQKNKNQDSGLKKIVAEILSNAVFYKAKIDKEVSLNISGDKDLNGNLAVDLEVDVVVSFEESGKKGIILIECEDSNEARGV